MIYFNRLYSMVFFVIARSPKTSAHYKSSEYFKRNGIIVLYFLKLLFCNV